MANFQTGTLVRVVPHRRRANAQRDGYAYPQLVGRIGRVEECLETTLNVAFSDQTAPNMQRAALVLATVEEWYNEIRTSMTRLTGIFGDMKKKKPCSSGGGSSSPARATASASERGLRTEQYQQTLFTAMTSGAAC